MFFGSRSWITNVFDYSKGVKYNTSNTSAMKMLLGRKYSPQLLAWHKTQRILLVHAERKMDTDGDSDVFL